MIRLVVNPLSGSGYGKTALDRVEQALKANGTPYEVFLTEYPKHAIQLTKTICQMPDTTTVVALGGDGTLNEVLNGFCNFDKVSLGIIPCGTGNDFANVANIPNDEQKAIDIILNQPAKYTDFLQMGELRGLNAIGTGIDVDVLIRYLKHKKRTKSTYFKSLLSSLMHFKSVDVCEEVGDTKTPHKAFIAIASNGKYIGGGLKAAPNAVIDDGLMEVLIVEKVPKLALPSYLIKLLRGKILTAKRSHYKRACTFKASSLNAPLSLQIDGEIYNDIPFDVQLITKQLRIHRI